MLTANYNESVETTMTATQLRDSAFEDPLTKPEPNSYAVVDLTKFPVLKNISILPVLKPGTYKPTPPEHDFQTYVVERGDTPNGIAEKFGINPETLLGGNPFLSEESTALQTGTELIILPADGVVHDVLEGETLEGLAQNYNIPLEDIVSFESNNLDFPYRLDAGTQIVVPGAVQDLFVWNPPQLATVSSRSSSEGRGVQPAIQGTGTFIWPITSRYMTQNY